MREKSFGVREKSFGVREKSFGVREKSFGVREKREREKTVYVLADDYFCLMLNWKS